MALSTDVNLPRRHSPIFPDRCVVCEYHFPKSRLWLVTGVIGWWSWLFGSLFAVKVPACRWCAWKRSAVRVISLLTTVAIVLAAWWYLWPWFKDGVPHAFRKWVIAGLVLVCHAPLILYSVFWPPPIDVTAFADSVDYEFASREYAVEFALLSRDATWVRVNGESIS